MGKRLPPAVTKRDLVRELSAQFRDRDPTFLARLEALVGVASSADRRAWGSSRVDRVYRVDAVARILSVSRKRIHNALSLHREQFPARYRRAKEHPRRLRVLTDGEILRLAVLMKSDRVYLDATGTPHLSFAVEQPRRRKRVKP